MKKIKSYLKLMRIKHYLKNVLVLLPLFFSLNFTNKEYIVPAIFGFICFCLTSSIIYILNDMNDIDSDKKHPIKKSRPLASGVISIKSAKILLSLLVIIIVLINIFILKGNLSYIFLIVYLILNILYTYSLKHKPIIDIFILSLGFLIRVLYGGVLFNIEISNWLFLTILSGALFMAFGKRKGELIKNGSESRKVLKYYNVDFVTKCMYMFLTMALTFYSLWTAESDNKYLVYSIPVLILICLFYMFDIEKEDSYADPIDTIFSDKKLLVLIGLFGLSLIVIMYVIPMVN